MKYALLAALLLIIGFSACKKDTYGYTCKCSDPNKQLADTFITYRLGTSGEAFYECKNFQDTANKYGRPYQCDLSK